MKSVKPPSKILLPVPVTKPVSDSDSDSDEEPPEPPEPEPQPSKSQIRNLHSIHSVFGVPLVTVLLPIDPMHLLSPFPTLGCLFFKLG